MSSHVHVPINLTRAATLAEMLAVVPALGECDTLEAIPKLAEYDRRATGWFTMLASCGSVAFLTAFLTLAVLGGLLLLGEFLISLIGSSADGSGETSNNLFLRLLMIALVLTLSALFFIFMGPKRWLVDSMLLLRQRITLRVFLIRALRTHLKRNRRLVDNKWRRAVCVDCLARFEYYRVSFPYGRWPGFSRCPKCRSDHSCYVRVRSIEWWLDQRMQTSQQQAGDVLKVNLLGRLTANSLMLPIAVDELVVADAADRDVETLIFLYRRDQPQTNLPKPERLRCRLTRDSTVSLMGRRQLEHAFRMHNGLVARFKRYPAARTMSRPSLR